MKIFNLFIGTTPRSSQPSVCAEGSPGKMTSNLTPQQTTAASSIPSLLASQQPAPMPQFILASGQLVQGIQGAQLLIPTSQGKMKNLYALS